MYLKYTRQVVRAERGKIAPQEMYDVDIHSKYGHTREPCLYSVVGPNISHVGHITDPHLII